jgi:hypothetical protein
MAGFVECRAELVSLSRPSPWSCRPRSSPFAPSSDFGLHSWSRAAEPFVRKCIDGPSGFAEALHTAYPKAKVQRCFVLLVRAALKYVVDKWGVCRHIPFLDFYGIMAGLPYGGEAAAPAPRAEPRHCNPVAGRS